MPRTRTGERGQPARMGDLLLFLQQLLIHVFDVSRFGHDLNPRRDPGSEVIGHRTVTTLKAVHPALILRS
jgi:hypothetical protein